MEQNLPADLTARLRADFIEALSGQSVATLRAIARKWGWKLKGTAKSELAAQLSDYMMDAPRMRAAYDALPEIQQSILQWVPLIGIPGSPLQIAAILSSVTQLDISVMEYREALEELLEYGLILSDEEGSAFVPEAFGQWLPSLNTPRLRYPQALTAAPSFSVSRLNTTIHRLLLRIESERPAIARPPSPSGPVSPGSSGRPFTRRPGLVSKETLVGWGFNTTAERDHARFMLELLALGGLITTPGPNANTPLAVDRARSTRWDATDPYERIPLLREWWLTGAIRENARQGAAWNELDLAIPTVEGYTLRYSVTWADAFTETIPVIQMRFWLMTFLSRLEPGVWYGLEEFMKLVRSLYGDLLAYEGYGRWQWFRGGKVLDAAKMDWDAWRATHGRLVEALLTGPVQWLGYGEMGYRDDRPVGFRIRAEAPTEVISLPQDVIRFTPPDTFAVQNVWQAGPLHALLSRVATESGRRREHTEFRLDAVAFRNSLDQGLTVDALAAAFAEQGAPLAASALGRLKEWEDRAGRFRLHEKVAVVEFGEDMPLEEIQAIMQLGGDWLYQAAPRCLVALEPEHISGLLADLRRRGYTPQVIR